MVFIIYGGGYFKKGEAFCGKNEREEYLVRRLHYATSLVDNVLKDVIVSNVNILVGWADRVVEGQQKTPTEQVRRE